LLALFGLGLQSTGALAIPAISWPKDELEIACKRLGGIFTDHAGDYACTFKDGTRLYCLEPAVCEITNLSPPGHGETKPNMTPAVPAPLSRK
jgi:hypothetical protein